MPKFGKQDFTADNATRLSVIIMPRMGKDPLTPFKSLAPAQQSKFNRLMNEYISSLGEDWEERLLAEFNLIVNEDILNENFNPESQFVPMINTDKEYLLTEEQEEFFADKPEELAKVKSN